MSRHLEKHIRAETGSFTIAVACGYQIMIVCTSQHERIEVSLSPEQFVRDAKVVIASVFHEDPSRVKLIFRGRLLSNDYTLTHYRMTLLV